MTSMPKVHDNTSCSNMSPDPSGTVNSLRSNTSNKTKTNLRKKTKTAKSKGAKLQVNKITKTQKFANSAFSNAFSLPKLGFVNEEKPWIDASFPSISSHPEIIDHRYRYHLRHFHRLAMVFAQNMTSLLP